MTPRKDVLSWPAYTSTSLAVCTVDVLGLIPSPAEPHAFGAQLFQRAGRRQSPPPVPTATAQQTRRFLPHQDTEMQTRVFLTLPQWPSACLKKIKRLHRGI